MSLSKKIWRLLTGRIALNIYFWAWWIYTVFNINANNAKAYHYDFDSPWFYVVIIGTLALLITATYTNNLWLMPKYFVRKKYLHYICIIIPLLFIAALIQVCLMKLAYPYIPVNDMQQAGAMSIKISPAMDAAGVFKDGFVYTIGNISWVFVFAMGWFVHDHARQQKILEAVQKKQTETELHFLKNQVNPHFLFNTLNNLYGLSLKHSDKGPDAILRLSSILRYMLYESNAPLVSFEREKEIMNAYIELELLRLPPGGHFHFTVEADKDYSIPPLLWLTALENVFKHATRVITDHYFIDFRFVIHENVLEIYSKNNYKNGVKTAEAGGIGLNNLNKRLALLYPGRHSIKTGSDDKYYTAEIQIALT